MLQKAIPVLPAVNLRATVYFYETRLGFKGINMGNYATVKSGFAEIHFQLITAPEHFIPASCLVYTDNIKDLYAFFAGKDMLYASGQMIDKKNGKKEFRIVDNNGNQIRFSEDDTIK
jgi:catechol 2,3-dioxygenase-like lactoylglutathione lyase family enzyme